MALGIADFVLTVLSLLLILTAGWATLRLLRAPAEGGQPDEVLSDGAVLIAEGGRVTRLADGARRLFGEVTGQPLRAALASLLGEGREEALGAVERLERTGEPVRLITRDRSGRTLELDGASAGGQLRLVLRDAELLERRLAAAEADIARREAAVSGRRREDETLRALLAGAPLIIWSRDPDGTPRWSGGAIAGTAGSATAAEVLPLLPPVARGGEPDAGPVRSRVEVTLAPGETVPLHATEVAAADGGAHGFAVDATAVSAAERTLSRFVQTMTETFAHLTVGLAIFDRNQTLALFNPALVQMWQVDASWLARRPSLREILESLRTKRRIPEVEDFHLWRGRLLALFDDPEQVDFEELWPLADGSSIRVLARPHPHGSLAFVFDDVTERMRLEQRFRHSIELRRATLDRMEEGLAVFTPDGILQFVNEAFHDIWGIDPDALDRTVHIRDLVQICSAASVEFEVWQRALAFITADEERRTWSTRLTLGSGRILSVRVAALPGGSSMIVFTDITDSERIAAALAERNDALEAADEMRTAVLDRISHRLRTPLNTVSAFARLLAEDRSGALSERQQDCVDGILEAAGQLLDTIDDVTELAALQIEPLHDEVAPHNVWETLETAAALLQERANGAGAVLEVAEPPAEAARLVCDLPALRQITFVMAAKALHWAGRGGRIELFARTLDETTLELGAAIDGAAAPAVAPGEEDGLAKPFLIRMIERAGGGFELIAGPDEGKACMLCRFPGALAATDGPAPEPGPEPPELLDDDPDARV